VVTAVAGSGGSSIPSEFVGIESTSASLERQRGVGSWRERPELPTNRIRSPFGIRRFETSSRPRAPTIAPSGSCRLPHLAADCGPTQPFGPGQAY
jgi:hypothetical protein